MPAPSSHAFSEKVALVTDGSDPVGRAVAMQLALYGCYVIVGFSDTADETRRALDELKNLGTLASAVESDVSSAEGAKNLVGEVEKTFGRLDLLVNCVKFRIDSAFQETCADVFDKTIGANLKAAFFAVQSALPLMKPRPKPKIVNIVSACDTEGVRKNVAFVAAQKAVIGLTETLAETLPKNFRVNAVAVSEKRQSGEVLDAELFRPRQGISADDAARAVVYLLSAEAIGVNGQVLTVA